MNDKDIHNWFKEIGLVDGLKRMKALEPFILPLIKENREQARKELIENVDSITGWEDDRCLEYVKERINKVLGDDEE